MPWGFEMKNNSIRPMSGRRKRGVRILVAGFLTLALLAVSACVFLRIHNLRDIEAYRGMAAECPPIWKAFAFRRFGSGDSTQELFHRFPPARRLEFGPYGIYSFSDSPSNAILFTSFSVVTRDGKLICAGAGSCTWQFTFFSTKDAELDRQYETFQQKRRRERQEAYLKKLEADLGRFHTLHDRWPTNEAELYWFVSGDTPPPEATTPKEKQFRKRYGLDKPPANPLGIVLQVGSDGAVTISSVGESNIVRTIPKPAN
jgi:hypothetical protein